MRILLFLFIFLLPLCASAQILRAYGVIEISGFPTSSTTGPKFAYNPADSSFYRWSSGNTWVKVIESSITQDTLYLTEQLGTTIKVSGDTINLTPYLLKSDTTSMLVRYIERGDTASMLTNYPSTAGYGIIDGGKTWRVDTTAPSGLATRKYTLLNPTSILADRLVRSNGSNLLAGNLSDNGTKLQALLPWQFHSWTTAGRPTGVSAYIGDNSTNDWFERYSTTAGAWISPLQSSLTGGKGTIGRVLFSDTDGRATDNANISWDNTNSGLFINSIATSADRGLRVRQGNSGIQGALINFEKNRSGGAVQNGDLVGLFTLKGYSGTQYIVDNALFGGVISGTVTSSSVPTSIFFNAGSTVGNYNTQLLLHHAGNVGIGNFGSVVSSVSAPSQKLHVIGTILAASGDLLSTSAQDQGRLAVVTNTNNSANAYTSVSALSASGTNQTNAIIRSFPPAYTNSDFGGSFVAGQIAFAASNFGRGASVNQKILIGLGQISGSATDTVETEFHRFSGSNAYSLTTRFASISNRGFQLPATTTANAE